MQIHGTNAVIVIGGVVIDPPVRVDAGGIHGDLISAVGHFDTAPLLIHCAKNVEKLANAFSLPLPRYGI